MDARHCLPIPNRGDAKRIAGQATNRAEVGVLRVMREIEGLNVGNLTITDERVAISGSLRGRLTLGSFAEVELLGMAVRNVIVLGSGRLTIRGTVHGDVTNSGGRLEIFGRVHGHLQERAGLTTIHPGASIEPDAGRSGQIRV